MLSESSLDGNMAGWVGLHSLGQMLDRTSSPPGVSYSSLSLDYGLDSDEPHGWGRVHGVKNQEEWVSVL